jgi:mono/diheme cytochrome c family protein
MSVVKFFRTFAKGPLLAMILVSAYSLAACGGKATSTPAPMVSLDRPTPPAEYVSRSNPKAGNEAAIQAGKQTWAVYCAPCHGETGQGDGPAAASLNPKPQPLAATQSGLSDAYLYWRIAEGGMGELFKSTMPSWKNLLSEEKVWEVIAFLRSDALIPPDVP